MVPWRFFVTVTSRILKFKFKNGKEISHDGQNNKGGICPTKKYEIVQMTIESKTIDNIFKVRNKVSQRLNWTKL